MAFSVGVSWFFVCFLFGHSPHVFGVTYGPSLVSLTKYDRSLRGPTYFSPDSGKYIPLVNYPNYSVVIPLVPDSPTATSNQVFLARRISGPGEFEIEAPRGYGVMAVIQSLDLRTAMTGCNDFIQFGEIEGVETTGICGKVDNRDGSFNPSGLVGPRVFLSPSGRMRMLFYHGYIWGLVRNFNFDILDPSRNPVLRVEVVFTAYKDCSTVQNQTKSGESFRPCSVSSLNSKTCINSKLFCDRIVNCGFEQDFGSDEDPSNCHRFPANFPAPTQPPPQAFTTQTIVHQQSAPTTESIAPTIQSSPPQPQDSISEATSSSSSSSSSVTPPNSGEENFLPETIIKNTINSSSESIDRKMPHNNDGELFVDADGSNSVLYETVDLPHGTEKSVEEQEHSHIGLVAGIVSLIAIIIILMIIFRVYYSFNKVIWNPNPNAHKIGKNNSNCSISSANQNTEPTELIISGGEEDDVIKCTNSGRESDNSKAAMKKVEIPPIHIPAGPPAYDALFPLPEKN